MSKFREYLEGKTSNLLFENNENTFNEWNGFKKGELVYGYGNKMIYEIEYFDNPPHRKAQGSNSPLVYVIQRYSPDFTISKKNKSNFDANYLKKIDKSKLEELIKNIQNILRLI